MLDLDGKKAWFTHGDFLESSLFGKKWVQGLGTGRLRILARMIGFKNKVRNATGKNPIQAPWHAEADGEDRLKKEHTLRQTAVKLAVGRGCEYLICGAPHHLFNLWLETSMGKCQYLSAGDWVQHLTSLEYNFKRWKSYRYSEDKLSPFFADEDLKKMNVEEILSENLKTGTAIAS